MNYDINMNNNANTADNHDSQDDQHPELLGLFFESDNQLETIRDLYSIDEMPQSYYNVLIGMLTSFISGEYDEQHTQTFLLQYYEMFYRECSENDDLNNINKLFEAWNSYALSRLSAEYVYNILTKLLDTIKRTQIEKITEDVNKYKMFSLITTTKVWSIQAFRKTIPIFPKQNTGNEYMWNGIFCSLFTLKQWESDTDTFLTAIDPIIKDESVHDKLVEYLSDILSANIAYTYDDQRLIMEKKCGSIDYNTFIMKILIKLTKYYGFDEIINYISTKSDHVVKDYDISDTNLHFFHKLYVTLLYSFAICHTPVIKKYYGMKNELTRVEKTNYLQTKSLFTKRNRIIKEIETIVELLNENSNKFIQNVYVSYSNVFSKIKSDEIFADIVSYVDHITSFSRLEKFYGEPNVKLFSFMSKIIGSCEGLMKNAHIRYYACNVILKLIKDEGFNVFENLFGNLFKYISEVDFFVWSSPQTSITHQTKLVETICMLTDYYDHEIEGSRDMIAGTLFVLFKKAIEIFGDIKEMCVYIRNKGLIVANETEYFAKMVNIISITLKIHQNVYERQIIKTVYPEVEHKYSVLVYDLLDASTDINHELYTVLKRPDLAGDITKITFSSIYGHIGFCSEYLLSIREIILDKIETNCRLSRSEKDEIIAKLTVVIKQYDYPAEFLDPLVCTPITDPVKIPNINGEIFDRVSIITHMHSSKENPYTKEPLTIEMLEEYNKTDEVVKEIQEFLERKKKFEEDN